MELHLFFDRKLERIINIYKPLEEWFLYNQNELIYYEFTNASLLDVDRSYKLDADTLVLKEMAKAIFKILHNNDIKSDISKAKCMVDLINQIYNSNKDKLSEMALNKYRIDNSYNPNKYTLEHKK